MSPKRENAGIAQLAEVTVTVTTTVEDRSRIIQGAVCALHELALLLSSKQLKQVTNVQTGSARYTLAQLDRTLTALHEAQHLQKTFNTQGEEEHGNEV